MLALRILNRCMSVFFLARARFQLCAQLFVLRVRSRAAENGVVCSAAATTQNGNITLPMRLVLQLGEKSNGGAA